MKTISGYKFIPSNLYPSVNWEYRFIQNKTGTLFVVAVHPERQPQLALLNSDKLEFDPVLLDPNVIGL